ncbi:hypothetical protein PIROE2DRAFT_12841 [Piromyces sp. E2]|nr:hypothetical protein PIROE2DRAFT_12841 [Piromyces sp. E2]|eukprot:OUM61213.1 hypothetical protein PIROE2DRAFT_12841 [Piromyces sp. E2]
MLYGKFNCIIIRALVRDIFQQCLIILGLKESKNRKRRRRTDRAYELDISSVHRVRGDSCPVQLTESFGLSL